MGKEIRTSAQKSAKALERARLERPQPAVKTSPQKAIIEDEMDEITPSRHAFKSEFPEIIPQSSNVNLQIFEQSIAIGEDPPMPKELDQLFRTDLEGVSLAMVRGFRRWKDYLHL